jgi:outer membrane protein TolC
MRMNKVAALAALLSAVSLSAPRAAPLAGEAQEISLDAEAAVKLALENNLSLKSGRLELGKAARARSATWNSLLPSIDASAILSRSNEEPAYPGLSPWNMALQLEASLPLSMAKLSSVRATILGYESGKIDYETAERQLEREVRKAFYALLLSRESIRLAERRLATAEKQYQNALKNYEAGNAPKLDALTAQVAAENLKPELEEQRVSYASSLMSFQLLLGLEPGDQLSLKGAIEAEAYRFDPLELSKTYLGGRLDIQALEKRIQIKENEKKLKDRAAYAPTLSASASYAPAINDPFAFKRGSGEDWTDNGQLTLSVSIPLDGFVPGSADRVASASARDDIEIARIALRQARQKAEVEIRSALLGLEKSLRTMDALALNVERAREAYDLTDTSYRAGALNLLEVQNASDELQKAELLLLKEKYNYLSGLIDLSYSLNAPLGELKEKGSKR